MEPLCLGGVGEGGRIGGWREVRVFFSLGEDKDQMGQGTSA